MVALLLAAAMATAPALSWEDQDKADRAAQVEQAEKCTAVERRYKRKEFFREMGAFVAMGLSDGRTATATTRHSDGSTTTTHVYLRGATPTLDDVSFINRTPAHTAAKAQALKEAGCGQ